MCVCYLSLFYVAMFIFFILFFLLIRRPPRSTRTDTLFPYTTLFRSGWFGQYALFYLLQGLLPAEIPAGNAWPAVAGIATGLVARSEEHTSELQSLMRISYAVFCLKKKTNKQLSLNCTTIVITKSTIT